MLDSYLTTLKIIASIIRALSSPRLPIHFVPLLVADDSELLPEIDLIVFLVEVKVNFALVGLLTESAKASIY